MKGKTLIPFVTENVSKNATIYTDELRSYDFLYYHCEKHETVNHSKKQWVKGDVHTNSIEGFWSVAKGGLRGVYRGRVRPHYLQHYINEYAFRHSHRKDTTPMFLSFLTQVRKSSD